MLFSIQFLIKKVLENCFFSAFGKILVLANAFLYSNSNSKSIEKLIFPPFGKTLVSVNPFFLFKFELEKN